MHKAGSIGIDVGGTKMLVGLFDDRFQLLGEVKVRTPAVETEEFTRVLTRCVSSLVQKAVDYRMRIKALGVGCAGAIDTQKGMVRESLNLPALKNYSFREILRRLVPVDALLVNDVNAALYGELKLGAAIGYKHVIGIFIGTGIGGAVAIDGKMYLGASGVAGDIGHYLVQPVGPLAGSERHGMLDDVASRTAIAAEAATLAAKQLAPHLLEMAGTDIRRIKAKALAKAIRAGDKAIEDLVRSRAQIIGIALSDIVDFLNPEMVVLGGGLTDALPRIIRQEVAAGIKAHATGDAYQALRVVTTRLKSHAVTKGAAKLAVDS